MTKTFLLISFCAMTLALIFVSFATAIAPMEPKVDSIKVSYADGNSIELHCKNANCLVELDMGSSNLRFDEDELYWQVVPKSPTLYTETGGGIDLSFEVQVVCPERLELERGKCFANYGISDGSVKDRVVFFIPQGATEGITQEALEARVGSE
jgi:hypothetical protein